MIEFNKHEQETFLKEGFGVFPIQEEPQILQVQRIDDAELMSSALGFTVPQLKSDDEARKLAQKYLTLDVNNHVISKRHEQ